MGDSMRLRGGESGGRLGDPPLLGPGDLLRGEGGGFRRGEGSLGRFGPSFSISALTLSVLELSLFEETATGFGGGETFFSNDNVNVA